MKKRLIALVLVLALALTVVFAACGPTEEDIKAQIDAALASYYTKTQVDEALQDYQLALDVEQIIEDAREGLISAADAAAQIAAAIKAHADATIVPAGEALVYQPNHEAYHFVATDKSSSHTGLGYVYASTDAKGLIDELVFDEVFWPYEWLRMDETNAKKIGGNGVEGVDYIKNDSNCWPMFMTFDGGTTVYKASLTGGLYNLASGTSRVRYFPFDPANGAIAPGATSFEGATGADQAKAKAYFDALTGTTENFLAKVFAIDGVESGESGSEVVLPADKDDLGKRHQINRSVVDKYNTGAVVGSSTATGGWGAILSSPSGLISSGNTLSYAVSFTKAGSTYTPGAMPGLSGNDGIIGGSRVPWDFVAGNIVSAVQAIGLRHITTEMIEATAKVNGGYIIGNVQTGASLANMGHYFECFRQVGIKLLITTSYLDKLIADVEAYLVTNPSVKLQEALAVAKAVDKNQQSKINTAANDLAKVWADVQATLADIKNTTVEATGDIWANSRVETDNYKITLKAVFDSNGKIVDILYTPSTLKGVAGAHVTANSGGGTDYLERWTTTSGGAASYIDWANALIGLNAYDVSTWTKPAAANASNGVHGITGLTTPLVTGATETGRNFVSSVVKAAADWVTANPRYLEIQATGDIVATSRVTDPAFHKITMKLVFDRATDEVAAVVYTSVEVSSNSTAGHVYNNTYNSYWNNSTPNATPAANHVAGYEGLITEIVGKTAAELAAMKVAPADKADFIGVVTGATHTTANFLSTVKLAAQKYLDGEAATSTWTPSTPTP